MAYQAIYRKWRPLIFEDVVGQTHITDTIKTELITNKVAHAYLFCGTRGTGKTTTAKILSRAINCENLSATGNPCNECPSCTGILNGTIMDVVEIDAASNNGVDNIRELRDEIIYTPANVKYKVYIIDEVHMLSTGAFNALLKTLEEPPSHAIFILATTEPHKIPATIQSRCQRFDFRRISNNHIAGRIGEIARKDNISISQDAIKLVASLGDGSMRDALSILDLCNGISGEITKADIENIAGVAGSDALFEIGNALIRADVSQAIASTDKAISMGRDITNLAEELLGFFRELLICKVSANPSEILDKSDEDLDSMKNLCAMVSEEMLIHGIRVLSDAISVCKWAANPKVILETSLIKICRPELDASSEAFAARIKKLESAVLLGGFSAPTVQEPTAPVSVTPQIAKPEKPAAVEPVKAEPAAEMTTEKPVEEKQEQPLPVFENTADSEKWGLTVDAIKQQDAGVGALLDKTKNKIQGDSFYIIFESEILKDYASRNEGLVKMLKKVAGNLSLKFVTQDELDAKKSKAVDPLDDLLAKKEVLGDQMTIF